MKNVSEFTKTQALIDEYNKLKNMVPNLETQMQQNENRTKVKIEKLKSDMQENQEDVEYKLDRAAVEAEYGKQIEQEEKNLEKENGKIKEEINKAKEDKKFFCTDKNFKTITMEIEAMKKEIEEGKLKIKQKEDELEKYDKRKKYERKKYEIKKYELEEQKISAKSDKEKPLKLLEIRKEQEKKAQEIRKEWEKKAQEIRNEREKKKQEIGKINKEIDAMNKKIDEYSEFKGELNQQRSTFTAIDFNKMRKRENRENNKANKPEEQPENNKTEKPEEQPENNKTEKPENNKANKPEEQPENNKTEKPEEQPENNKTEKPEGQPENNKTEKPEEQPENDKTEKPEEKYEDIYSNSQDFVKAIHIEATTGKAYIDTFKNNKKEIDIKEAIEDRKGLYKRIGIKEIMQRLGIDSKIKQFALKRKMNPVILQAIHEDKDLTEEYIDCLIENREFPFKYKNSLMNSSLSNKDTAFMNRIALKERKIEENEIVGAERLYKIKTFFKNVKNKVNKRIETRKVEMLDSAENKETKDNTKSKKEEFRNRIEKYNEQNSIQRRADKIVTELEKKYDEAYNSLSDEQKSKLSNMSIRDIQKLGFDYSTSVALSEKQEKNNDENGKEKDDER